ncbi:MAG: phosphate ABC transporter substrate-binding protein PstS [Syntrophobacteraceae bacterium]
MSRMLSIGLILFACACPTISEADAILRGAGATFPYPLYSRWIELYQPQTRDRISYQPVGSGAGITLLIQREVDFGGTDAFLSDEELNRAPAAILHVPTCVGAVAVIYQLPISGLKLTPELLADIFMGRITRWSDKKIAQVNPSVILPQLDITVVHRSDGSGTTFIFTDYLSKVSPSWKEKAGSGKVVKWPTGIGIEGNHGIVDLVKKIPGSISYTELAYARKENLPAARIKNRSGNFIEPTLESASAAAEVDIPPDSRLLINDTPASHGYPIAGFSYIILFKDQSYGRLPQDGARALARFLWWMIHEGQQYSEQLHYSRLPERAVQTAEGVLRSVSFNGPPVLDR